METITRRRLPHWYVPGAAHFVTYRLAGTIPLEVIRDLAERCRLRLRQRPANAPRDYAQRVHKQAFAAFDEYLDEHRAIDWLARPEVANIVRDNLYFHRGSKYHLMAYCLMPNHVHVLLQPVKSLSDACNVRESDHRDHSLSEQEFVLERSDSKGSLTAIMHSLKSYTAKQANKVLNRQGQFWQHESYDHWVRDDDELERIVDYIAANPVRAGLVQRPENWAWSSAHDQYLVNQDASGWIDQR